MGYALPRFRRKRREPHRRSVLEPYTGQGYWQRHRRLGLTLLGFFAFFYGAFFSITTIYFLMQLAVPLAALALLVIWLLPETGKAHVRTLEWLFFSFIAAFLFWPNYLALALPGLPWITALRLIVAPLAIIFLISLSQSKSFRDDLKTVLNASPIVWKMVTTYTVISVIGVALSIKPTYSLHSLVVILSNWTLIFFISAYILTKDGRMERLSYLVALGALFICLIGTWEAKIGAVPWAGHIPSFLKIEDPVVEAILVGVTRGGGDYRVQSKFTTPLSLAEFISCALPFVFFTLAYARRWFLRALALVAIPLIFFVVYKTDARLGIIGCICAIVMYPALYGIKQWKNEKSSLFAPAVVLGIPAAGFVLLLSSFFIGRVGKLIWGSGQQVYSTNARYEQLHGAIPKIMERPWGYGLDQGAGVLNYRIESGLLTIDSYYLSLALDIGLVGLVAYSTMFAVVVFKMAELILKSDRVDREHMLMGSALICLVQFMIIKLVLAQTETHPFFFTILGASVALIYRRQSLLLKEPGCDSSIAGSPNPNKQALSAPRQRGLVAGVRVRPQESINSG